VRGDRRLGAVRGAGPKHSPNPAADIIIVGGQLFDGTRETLVPNRGIVIRQGIFSKSERIFRHVT
jgi:hypothetical protein